jgi:hypothetical protein
VPLKSIVQVKAHALIIAVASVNRDPKYTSYTKDKVLKETVQDDSETRQYRYKPNSGVPNGRPLVCWNPSMAAVHWSDEEQCYSCR